MTLARVEERNKGGGSFEQPTGGIALHCGLEENHGGGEGSESKDMGECITLEDSKEKAA